MARASAIRPTPATHPLDLVAAGLACAAGALGAFGGTGPLLALLAAGVAAGGILRARAAPAIVLFAVAPLLVVIGWGRTSVALGALALAASAALWWVVALRETPPSEPSDGVLAARIVLAIVMCAVTVALIVIFRLFV
jgi:hypothetical protein